MAHYKLYLDESETHNASGSSFFVVGSVILNVSSEVAVTQELDALKSSLWTEDQQAASHILHEKEITEANKSGRSNDPCYMIFRANGTVKKLYAGLSKLLKTHAITTMGVCVNSDELSRLYPGETNSKLTIALQMLLENYCHFLKHNAATFVMNHSRNREISRLDSGSMSLKLLAQCITLLTFFKRILETLSFAQRIKTLRDYSLPTSFQTQWHVQLRGCRPNTIHLSKLY